jgi:hypothetical protein
MAEFSAQSPDARPAEALPAVGLILNMASVIAFALCVAGVGMGSLTLGVTAGTVALASFAGSLVVLFLDGKRFAEAERCSP